MKCYLASNKYLSSIPFLFQALGNRAENKMYRTFIFFLAFYYIARRIDNKQIIHRGVTSTVKKDEAG